MVETFLQLSDADKLEALEVAASTSGRPVHLLEKDVWLVWSVDTLFRASFGDCLVFKGGTSLSKAYRAIDRFSEDVDLTYDIRALIPDLVGDAVEALPPSRSQESKWTKAVRQRLPDWIRHAVVPELNRALDRDGISARLALEGVDKIYVDRAPLAGGSEYVRPGVLLEFGARSTGEPCDTLPITCDAAPHLDGVAFPEASPRVMRVERTFWEKATAAHVYCKKGRPAGHRFSRHWHDLTRLDATGHAGEALQDSRLALSVARHKNLFFAEKDGSGRRIDYVEAVQGGLTLVPVGEALAALREDYRRMLDDGLLLRDAEDFDTVMATCRQIERRANGGIH